MTRKGTTAPLVLGIDFGTSNSAAALLDANGVMHTMALDSARSEMPTAVFFGSDPPCQLYGSEAMQAYLQGHDGRLLRSLKSLLGSRLMDEHTAVNDRTIAFFDIVVLFLKELKRRSELQLGQPLTHAMLGRPVHFVDDDLARDDLAQATLARAARQAGFTHIAFQMEPIAAALDFEQQINEKTTALIVDIGGGTSDFTVIRLHGKNRNAMDRSTDILATAGVHIGGTDFDRLLDLATVMPLLGYKHLGTGSRPVPNSVFFDLSTWHLIHQSYTRKAMHFAKELWTDYRDLTLHQRLMSALEGQHGHRILTGVEAAKIACSVTGTPAAVALDFLDVDMAPCVDASAMATTLESALTNVVQCALACVESAGLAKVDTVYLTGGSSALRPLMDAFANAMPRISLVQGNLFGSVATGLAYAGARHMAQGGRWET